MGLKKYTHYTRTIIGLLASLASSRRLLGGGGSRMFLLFGERKAFAVVPGERCDGHGLQTGEVHHYGRGLGGHRGNCGGGCGFSSGVCGGGGCGFVCLGRYWHLLFRSLFRLFLFSYYESSGCKIARGNPPFLVESKPVEVIIWAFLVCSFKSATSCGSVARLTGECPSRVSRQQSAFVSRTLQQSWNKARWLNA